MYHGGYLENILWWKFAIDDNGVYPNLSLCFGINALVSDLNSNKILLMCKALKHHCNCSKMINKYNF
jgi:hypothetical protein